MEVGDMLNARHAAAADAQLRQQLQQASQMDSRSAYAMNANHGAYSQQQPVHHDSHMTYPSMNASSHSPQLPQDSFIIGPSQSTGSDDMGDENGTRINGEIVPKAFACSTCAKGFARRSDLARHERIHSGVRPHQCEHPGCGKQFIQRSALTVHMRVHTGEKPHMCERCGKPFSDSSSLARHRRIHSGKRPYKCPYANCQKTFTRRTTLTRHQNHHTGTIEQAAVETNAKLSTTQHQSGQQEGDFSDNASSQNSTDSPAQRPISMSPSHDLPPIPNMHRQNSDYGYMPQNNTLPPHLRNDFPSNSPRSSPAVNSTTLANYTSAPHHRPAMTSHPNPYGPPQPLEPPANGTASGSGSPHLTALGWGSPNHNGNIPSPGTMENYAYPDPTYGGAQPLYYPGSNIRRPQSTEPEDYGLRPRGNNTSHVGSLHNGHNSMSHGHMGHGGINNTHHHLQSSVPMTADWSNMPVKEERYVL